MLRRLVAVVGVALFGLAAAAEPQPALKDARERVSYAMGVEAGQQFQRRVIDLDPDAFARGLKAVLSGATPLLNDEQVRQAIAELQSDLKRREFEARSLRAELARKAAGEFLVQNQSEEGVVVLPSGLQYKILKPGAGRKPADADAVEVSYTARLVNGMEFDSSSRGGSSPILRVNQTIAGLSEALKLMPTGAKWQVFVPPALATGPRTATAVIPPDQALIYEIELLAIK